MTLAGSLDDVSVPDVFQFVHFGRSTGTLVLTSGDLTAEIGFHEGEIINARGSGTLRLGDLLVSKALIGQEDLERALMVQRELSPPRALGDILIDEGVVSEELVRRAIIHQIRETILQAVLWTGGSFEFSRGRPRLYTDLADRAACERLADIKLNTERILLEAAQLVDEALAVEAGQMARSPGTSAWERDIDNWAKVAQRQDLAQLDSSEIPIAEIERHVALAHSPVRILTSDEELYARTSELLTQDQRLVESLTSSGRWLLVDLRPRYLAVSGLLQALHDHSGALAMAVIDDVRMVAGAYAEGAKAAVPPDPEAIVACFRTLSRERNSTGMVDRQQVNSALAKLRRVMGDIRSGLMSTTVALALMNFVGEAVERAIIFLVRRRDMVTIGAFGFGLDGRPLADLSRGLSLSLDDASVLNNAVADGRAHCVSFEAAHLPAALALALGPPANDQIVALPVLGTNRVLAVIYADNGALMRSIEDLEVLEIASAQVGAALENEILRRELQRRNSLPSPQSPGVPVRTP